MWLLTLFLVWQQSIQASHPIPRMTALRPELELETLPWSPNTLRLRDSGTLYIYHNYTCLLDEPCRYLDREIVPNHSRVIRSHVELGVDIPLLSKRGFIANPDVPVSEIRTLTSAKPIRYVTWNWKRPSPNCPALINFCFKDQRTKDELEQITDAAFEMWHNALGPLRGVRLLMFPGIFETGPLPFCKEGNSWRQGLPSDVVMIETHNQDTRYNGLGWRPGSRRGRMILSFNSHKLGDDETMDHVIVFEQNVAAMAHELGEWSVAALGYEQTSANFQRSRYGSPCPLFPDCLWNH